MKKDIHIIHSGARGNNCAHKANAAHGKKETCAKTVSHFSQNARSEASSRIEIIENSFEWTVEPGNGFAGNAERELKRGNGGTDATGRDFEELRQKRERHYAAMAAAGVLPEEAPFEQEEEFLKMRDEGLGLRGRVEGSGRVKKCWRWLTQRFAGVMMILAIPAIGGVFGAMAAFAAIAEEGGF